MLLSIYMLVRADVGVSALVLLKSLMRLFIAALPGVRPKPEVFDERLD